MKTGDIIEKPWGYERILDLNDRYCIKELFVNQGQRLSKQYHEHKRETMFLKSGGASLLLASNDSEDELQMVRDQPYTIEPGTVHRLKGTSPDGALILEMSSPEIEDVIRIEDDYGR
jgi:mannose-6-phosphate isomerase